MKMKYQRIPVAQRTNVRVGKRPETPKRVMVSFRLKVETKQQLEELSNQLDLSQTVAVETIVDYFARASDSEASRIKLETQKDSLERQLSKTKEKLKKLNLGVDNQPKM